jgi:hypothetical protein
MSFVMPRSQGAKFILSAASEKPAFFARNAGSQGAKTPSQYRDCSSTCPQYPQLTGDETGLRPKLLPSVMIALLLAI